MKIHIVFLLSNNTQRSISILNTNYTMGVCNNKLPNDDNSYSTKAILETAAYQKVQFYFSTQTLLRVDADCLIIYCDQKINLQKNIFLSRIGKSLTRKIRQFAQAYLIDSQEKLSSGQIIIFPINITTLMFKFVALVCLKTWDGQQKIKTNLQNTLINLFRQLDNRKIKTVAITQFNEQFGIPTQLGCKLISEALYNCRKQLKVVTFICSDSTTQSYFIQKIQNFKRNEGEVNLEQHRRTSLASNYF